MPPFMPNEKMLELHRDKGTEPWEIYAWCVRDAIAKASGLPKFDNASLRAKKNYESLYTGRQQAIEVDGVKYTRSMFGDPDAKGIPVERDLEADKGPEQTEEVTGNAT